MNLIRSLMGRRQFLVAAGVTSASAMAFKKLGGIVDHGIDTGIAHASTSSSTEEMKGHFSDKYKNLLSPIKIGNVVLKNRMMSCNATPHFLQGPENFPADPTRNYYVNLAKNGAGVIIPRILTDRVRKDLQGDSAHMVIFDLEDYGVQNYLDQMVEAVHCYDTKVCHTIRLSSPGAGPGIMPGVMAGGGGPEGGPGAGGPEGMPGGAPGGGAPPGGGFGGGAQSGPSIEDMQKMIEDAVTEAKFYYNHGFDMVNLRQSFLTKNRTDQYGGSIENRARFAIELCQAIKKACGQDFLIWYPITVIEPWINLPSNEDLYNMDELKDVVALARELEGHVDILEIRDAGANTAFTFDKTDLPMALRFTQAIKESGAKIVTAPNGGLGDPDRNEEFIATGKTDLISMGRTFICDWEYGTKVCEGRGEDTVPCIMCNKCHGISNSSDWYTVCSVNPKIAIEPAVRAIEPPNVSRKVAVIGGGPAGMKAALVAVERGHRVTLYEKGNSLGGLLQHTDFFPYKWPLKDFKDYLINQVKKAGIEVQLNTAATPEMIKSGGYEVILVALGAKPIIPPIPGVDASNVWNVVNVCGKEKSLGKNVVVIGAGETGTETGIYLAKAGHSVTVITSENELVQNNRVHYPSEIIDAYKRLDNFFPVTGATVTGISKGKVNYRDANGNEKSIQADSVVIYAGLRAKKDEALKFYGSAKRFFAIGECGGAGFGVQRTIRNAFFAASQI